MKYISIRLLFVFLSIVFITCSGKKNFKDTRAEQSEIIVPIIYEFDEDSLAQSVVGSKKYIIDIENSKIKWFCGKHSGIVDLKSGYINSNKRQFINAEFLIKMGSLVNLDIDYILMKETLQNMLKSNEFLNVVQYPFSKFTVTEVAQVEGNSYHMTSSLLLLGVSKSIDFTSKVNIVRDSIFAQTDTFTINRTDWGITTMSVDFAKSADEFTFVDDISFVIELVGATNN